MPFDDFDRNFDKQFNRISGVFIFMVIASTLTSLAFLGFLVWLAVQILEKF